MKKRILIVDDDSTILETVSIILREEGYVVSTLPNGNLLEKTVRQTSPNLAIFDYLMPGKNGDELTRILKSMKGFEHVPVLILAASQQYKESALKAGADTYMTKPFDMYKLLDEIKRLMVL